MKWVFSSNITHNQRIMHIWLFKDSDCKNDYDVIREVIRDVDGFCSIEYIDAKETRNLLAQSLERISGYSYRSKSFVNVS